MKNDHRTAHWTWHQTLGRAWLLAMILPATFASAQTVPPAAVGEAVGYFQEALASDSRLALTLRGLQSTGDGELIQLFEKLARSNERDVRLMAVALLPELAGTKATPALKERLRDDPIMVIRGEALVQLAAMDKLSPAELEELLAVPDEGVQALAARELVRKKSNSPQARQTLRKLTASRHKDTAVLARMTLLAAGDRTQIGPLRKVVLDPTATAELLVRLLKQIREEQIAAALPVAEFLAGPDQLLAVRLQAFMTLAELKPQASSLLRDALARTENPMLRINLLRLLAERPDSAGALKTLAASAGPIVPTLARFELARKSGDAAAAQQAAGRLLGMQHPIVVEYVLNRMRTDVDANPQSAGFYVQPMLALLENTPVETGPMTRTHDRLALAVELLGDIGSEDARKGLWDILRGREDARQRLVAGALVRTSNRETADLVRPLLKSPYRQLRTYAALLLGKFNDPAAVEVLLEVQANADKHRDDVLVLANWYLLRLANRNDWAVEQLMNSVR